ncbi:hypothetical protein [Hyphomicrobium sp.]|uniref:hypothetical protein n=1 Tax=Hyphomicrobium sp. TaxID=82 RepID=UPI002FE01A4D
MAGISFRGIDGRLAQLGRNTGHGIRTNAAVHPISFGIPIRVQAIVARVKP